MRIQSRRFFIAPLLAAVLAAGLATAFFILRDFQSSRAAVAAFRPDNEPARLEIGAIGLDSPIVSVGFKPGTRKPAVPDTEVGWFEPNSAPDQAGVVFLVGHNDGIFENLHQVAPGDRITITLVSAAAAPALYEVYTIATLPYADISMRQVLAPQDHDYELVLMTCAGDFSSELDTYTERLILRAKRV